MCNEADREEEHEDVEDYGNGGEEGVALESADLAEDYAAIA